MKYTAKRTSFIESGKDGNIFPNWDKAISLKSFTYPWLMTGDPNITFRALWNSIHLYFRFDVIGKKIKVFNETNDKMEVLDSDRVEIFIRSDEKMDPYYCLEMDPLGRTLDYGARYYRQFDYDWEWQGADHLLVNGKMTETGYVVEGRITMQSLKDLHLLKNNEIQAGLFRGECLTSSKGDSKFSWISWIKPISDKPDFHIPSSFGTMQFVE